jgi:hypothetical protein
MEELDKVGIVLQDKRNSLWRNIHQKYKLFVPSSESRKIEQLPYVSYPCDVSPHLYCPIFNTFLDVCNLIHKIFICKGFVKGAFFLR